MLRSIRIRGGVSNFKAHSSGHWYFTLKDDQARIACVMFRQHAMRMSLRPRDGMAVVLSGSVSLYTQSGTYQFYAENLRPDGIGGLPLLSNSRPIRSLTSMALMTLRSAARSSTVSPS